MRDVLRNSVAAAALTVDKSATLAALKAQDLDQIFANSKIFEFKRSLFEAQADEVERINIAQTQDAFVIYSVVEIAKAKLLAGFLDYNEIISKYNRENIVLVRFNAHEVDAVIIDESGAPMGTVIMAEDSVLSAGDLVINDHSVLFVSYPSSGEYAVLVYEPNIKEYVLEFVRPLPAVMATAA